MSKSKRLLKFISSVFLSVSLVGGGVGRASAQTSSVVGADGDLSPTTGCLSSYCGSKASGVEINPSTNSTSDANGNKLQNTNSATVAPISNDSSAAVKNISDLANQQGQSLTASQKQALSNYFNSNPSAAASATANPQQFLTTFQKNQLQNSGNGTGTAKVTGSGNNAGQTLINQTNNPGLSDLQALLLGLKPVTVLPVQPGNISTGNSNQNCPYPVYSTKGDTTNLYVVGWSHSKPVLAPGQEEILGFRNKCLQLEQINRIQAAPMKNRVSFWNTGNCLDNAPTILGELFDKGLSAQYLHMNELLSQRDPKTGKLLSNAACQYGIMALFPNTSQQNVSSAEIGIQIVSGRSRASYERQINLYKNAANNYFKEFLKTRNSNSLRNYQVTQEEIKQLQELLSH